ncbi:allantoinase AllB [Salibacterium qingdaonense]|uniref:Allantoinase n=1 Tax=Salibacterium qingdaonense TaxID=266892 RepID=A0A1I4HYE9_9BACI|nr:allantoinase AllB [Salibacterium qingdaonense]SFL46847.1 allantoinase [Salibacterium qingdaonense]
MKAWDTVIRNGKIVLDDRVEQLDIGIRDGIITALETYLDGTADWEYDAAGCHVFPGLIDVHVHFNEPGRTDWEGFQSGSQMLAAGGCTTFFDMPLNGVPSTVTQEALIQKKEHAGRHSILDAGLWGGLMPGHVHDIKDMADGVIGFKAFMAPSGNPEFEKSDDQTLLDGMKEIADCGKVLALHAESAPIIEHMKSRQTGTDADSYARSRPAEAESEAVRRALSFARVTGCALHFVHISNAETIHIIDQAKKEGMDVTVETCAHYLLFNHNTLRSRGAAAKCAPPLRGEQERQALMQCLLDNKIDMVTSDHSPCPPDLKDTDDMFQAWGGINGGQFTLSALIETALSHNVPLSRVAKWGAQAPARRFQMEDTKGAVQEGLHADLSIVDLRTETRITQQDLYTKHRQSLYEGHTFPCRIVRTFQRGRTVYDQKQGAVEQP